MNTATDKWLWQLPFTTDIHQGNRFSYCNEPSINFNVLNNKILTQTQNTRDMVGYWKCTCLVPLYFPSPVKVHLSLTVTKKIWKLASWFPWLTKLGHTLLRRHNVTNVCKKLTHRHQFKAVFPTLFCLWNPLSLQNADVIPNQDSHRDINNI